MTSKEQHEDAPTGGTGLSWARRGLVIFSLAAVMALLALPSSAIEFEENAMSITKVSVGFQGGIDLAVGPEDQLYAVWEDGRLAAWQAGSAIFFTVSEPNARGRSFSDAIHIEPTTDDVEQLAPAMAVGPDGVIHVVWQQRSRDDTPGPGPFWEVHYSRSVNGGFTWSDPIRLSQLNNRNNTRPDVAAISGGTAYVAWDMEDRPGTSVPLALVEDGSRRWYREGLAMSSTRWELNGGVSLATDGNDALHATWSAIDMDGMWDPVESQVLYLTGTGLTATSVLPAPIRLVDDPLNTENFGQVVTVTRRHGPWVTWVQLDEGALNETSFRFLADRVTDGGDGEDVLAATMAGSTANSPRPMVATALGSDDGLRVAISNIASLKEQPWYVETCSELGCFSEAARVVAKGEPRGLNASIAADPLGNVYVAWDDGNDIWLVQRRNSPPGAPELTSPDRFTHDPAPEFKWTFNDPDASPSQSSFEIQYSRDPSFSGPYWGGVVTGALGRSSRYVPANTIDEGKWYWRVRTRDQLGLWSEWSVTRTFLADWTPPTATVVINDGADLTLEQVVVLTLNATDNLADVGDEMYFQVSNDPNFVNASTYEYPPPNHQVNHRLSDGEGVKVVFLRVIDASELAFTALDTILFNVTPLDISHTPILSAPANKPLTVRCDIARFEGVTATLIYRRVGDDAFTELGMESNGSMFWGEVPKDSMSTKGLEYLIKARSSGGTVYSPPEGPTGSPYEVEVFETTDVYTPPIYAPEITLVGAAIVAVVLFSIWYFRIRD